MTPSITPDNWPIVSSLLDDALALPPPAREQWLQSLTGERAAHRDTLRELLSRAGDALSGDFLDTLPPLPQLAPLGPVTELAAGDPIGPYRLLSKLGVGGMGEVWLAERTDGTMRRKVALKLPHLSWAGGLVERMARERDILATLEHPHIARLYDAGADPHGRPFLALEYVEGQPIDAFCQQHALAVNDRLHLLLQVCSAVAFAHSRLVVHRDLKPSNILVTAGREVRLLDFGVAKLLQGEGANDTQLTRLNGRAMTLDYASPEQIKGEPIGTTSDVYSLGVVAFELLTGTRPYRLRRGSAAELEEAITSAEPARASVAATLPQVGRALRGDLDAILHKALQKSPAERYATVDALAADLQRHLAQEPVLARPDSAAYRAGRFVTRHRLPVALTAVTVTTMLAAAVIALRQASEATLQRDRALLEAETREEVSRFVVSLFAVPDPPRVEIIDRGRDRVLNGQAQASEAVRGRLLKVLGDLYVSIGNLDSALTVYEGAVEAARQPAVADRRAQAEALVALATAQTDNGLLAQGRDSATRALGLLDERQRDQEDLVARANQTLGQALTNTFEYDKARPYIARAIELHTRRTGPHGRDALTSRYAEARLSFRSGNATLGIDQMRQVLGDMRTHLGPRDADSILALETFGSFLGENGQYLESEATLRESIARRGEVYGTDHPSLSGSFAILGRVLFWAGEVKRALPEIHRSIELERKGNPRPTPYLAYQQEWLFRAYLAGGDVERADAAFREGISILSGAGEPESSLNHLRLWRNHVQSQLLAGRLDAVREGLERLRPLARQHDDRLGLRAVVMAEAALTHAVDPATAARHQAAIDELLPSLGRNKALAMLSKARASRHAQDLAGAARAYDEALRLATKDFAHCPAELLPAGLEAADTLQLLGQPLQTRELLNRLAPCAERAFEGSHWRKRWAELARR